MAHIKARTTVENSFGSWKARFAILLGKMQHAPTKSGQIIIATACLHNFAVSKGDIWVNKKKVKCVDDHDPRDNYHYGREHGNPVLIGGKAKRQEIVQQYFR